MLTVNNANVDKYSILKDKIKYLKNVNNVHLNVFIVNAKYKINRNNNVHHVVNFKNANAVIYIIHTEKNNILKNVNNALLNVLIV